MSTAAGEPGGAGTGAVGQLTVRLVMPDRWLEHVTDLPSDATVEEAKTLGLEAMLLRSGGDADDYYVDYAERTVPDESISLAELGFQSREILSIRAYDLGHPRPFSG